MISAKKNATIIVVAMCYFTLFAGTDKLGASQDLNSQFQYKNILVIHHNWSSLKIKDEEAFFLIKTVNQSGLKPESLSFVQQRSLLGSAVNLLMRLLIIIGCGTLGVRGNYSLIQRYIQILNQDLVLIVGCIVLLLIFWTVIDIIILF